MEQYNTLKKDYKFTEEDTKILKSLQRRMEKLADTFIDEFHNYILDLGASNEFLKDKGSIENHLSHIKLWFLGLFSGTYDISYFMNLRTMGEGNLKMGVSTHYVNATFSFVRTFVRKNIGESLEGNPENKVQYTKEMPAIEKIIDINLDIFTSAYREEELGKFLSLSAMEKRILVNLKKVNSYFNFFLAGALAMVAFFAVGLFAYDVYSLFFTDIGIEKGILTVLGSLLVLWAAIELIQEEINHLQGKGFAIGAFIMLAMAALIRKVLIYSLSSEKSEELIIVGGVIVALALAYWLVGHNKKFGTK